MSYTEGAGRLANQIIRNFALHFLVKKHHLKASYQSEGDMIVLGLDFAKGTVVHKHTRQVADKQQTRQLQSSRIAENVVLGEYYQNLFVSGLIFNELRGCFQGKVRNANPFKERYSKNNDIFVHIRLGDVEQFFVGLDYQRECIRKCKEEGYNDVFIASDSLDHEMIQKLCEEFQATKVDKNPIQTLQWGSTCAALVLSQGSQSAYLGWTAFDTKQIWQPESPINNPCKWASMDLFHNKGWNQQLLH